MSEPRFRLLEIEMLRRGVAPRHARRAMLELESHHRDLIEQAIIRGETLEGAERSAHEALGSDTVLIERWAQERALRAWPRRWRAGYVFAPLLGFAAVLVVEIMTLIAFSSRFSVALHHTRLPAALTHDIEVLQSVLLLWVAPVAVAMVSGVLAGRQRVELRWLIAGLVVLSIFTAQMNVRFVLTGGSPLGVVGAGIGFSTADLPLELTHVLIMAALTLIPAGWLRYREIARQPALE